VAVPGVARGGDLVSELEGHRRLLPSETAEWDRNWLLMTWDERAMFVLIGEQDGPTPVDELTLLWEDPEVNARIRRRAKRMHAAVERRFGVNR
jgi:hypothetical protein